MMNSRLSTWHDHVIPSEESSTPEVKCKVFKIDYAKPLPQPKKGRTLSSFIDDWVADPEKSEAFTEAMIWTGEMLSELDNGETIKTLRLKKGLSQSQLANLMQTSQPHIARIEKGRDSMTLETLCKLSEHLAVDYNTLVCAIKLQEQIVSSGTKK